MDLNVVYRRLVYAPSLEQVHASRFYYTVPVCEVRCLFAHASANGCVAHISHLYVMYFKVCMVLYMATVFVGGECNNV
ncbi:hypothetical protein EON63_24905 [archaeon]|nr:MAG: hypothetical protein EON63_24905 [archaeon]